MICDRRIDFPAGICYNLFTFVERKRNQVELWTQEHIKLQIPVLVAIALIVVALKLLLGKRERKIRMIPVQIIVVLLILLEVGKQTVSFMSPNGYDLYCIPLHFCSLYLFALPLMAFYRGRHQAKLTAVTSTMCVGLLLFMLIYPALIFPASDVVNMFTNYLSFHTIAFHNLVVLATVLIFVLKLNFPVEKGEKRWVVVATLLFCGAAGSMAQILKTNFANFYSCNIPPLENVRLSLQGVLGYGLSQTLYVLILTVLHVLFMLLCYGIYRGIRRLLEGKQLQKVN